jgi:hypothetical protein
MLPPIEAPTHDLIRTGLTVHGRGRRQWFRASLSEAEIADRLSPEILAYSRPVRVRTPDGARLSADPWTAP